MYFHKAITPKHSKTVSQRTKDGVHVNTNFIVSDDEMCWPRVKFACMSDVTLFEAKGFTVK